MRCGIQVTSLTASIRPKADLETTHCRVGNTAVSEVPEQHLGQLVTLLNPACLVEQLRPGETKQTISIRVLFRGVDSVDGLKHLRCKIAISEIRGGLCDSSHCTNPIYRRTARPNYLLECR